MHSLHRYLVARYHISDPDEYLHLLAMYRNTAAIEALNSRTRYEEIRQAILQVNSIRNSLVSRLQARRRA
jgi:hypothetical protein